MSRESERRRSCERLRQRFQQKARIPVPCLHVPDSWEGYQALLGFVGPEAQECCLSARAALGMQATPPLDEAEHSEIELPEISPSPPSLEPHVWHRSNVIEQHCHSCRHHLPQHLRGLPRFSRRELSHSGFASTRQVYVVLSNHQHHDAI